MIGQGFTVEVCACNSQIGSGALPLATIPSAGLAIRAKARGGLLEKLSTRLRGLSVPVIGRIEDDALKLDLRCLTDEEVFLAQIAELSP
jgi:L-seryl-tRNA(Ser) seleniumtransferase